MVSLIRIVKQAKQLTLYQQERQEKHDLEFSLKDIYMYRAAFAIPEAVWVTLVILFRHSTVGRFIPLEG